MVGCAEFLDGYSEFRDGLLTGELEESFERHLEDCPACARYHGVVSRGAAEFARLPEIAPSEGFALRLQDRLMEEEWTRRRASSAAPVGVTVAVAAALGLAAWLPALRRPDRVQVLPAVLAQLPSQEAPAASMDGGTVDVPLRRYVPIHAGLIQPALYPASVVGGVLAYPLPLSSAGGN
jgi:anti-sigma factor RsiW